AVKVDDDPAAAVPLCREALALDPNHLDARYYRGNCLAVLGDTDAAIAEFERLLEIDPRSHRTLKRLGILRVTDATSPDELEQGLAVLQRALEVNREETGVLLAMSDVELLLGRHDEAARRLELVCRTNPRAVAAFYLRGYVAWKRGDHDAARDLLERAHEARGPEWVPEGMTAEGDVGRSMHTDETPLSRFCRQWDGTPDPSTAFGALDAYVAGAAGPREN
ncbi:MAG: tetratricopeptide repeat protein, partial [Planctomycetota bacterium]